MSLNRSQKKYIKKNSRNASIFQMAATLGVTEDEVRWYLGHNGSRHEQKTLLGKEQKTEINWNEIASHPLNWIKKNLLFFGILTLLVLVSYANALGNAFVSDDRGLLINVPIWDLHYFLASPHAFLRPLIYIIVYKLGGLNPFLFRLPNILFHLGVVWLVYAVLSTFIQKRAALAAAALFAVHPLLVESVTWISGGGHVQYSFFFLLSFLFYILSSQRSRYYFLSLFFYTLMLISSEKAVSLAVSFFLFELSFGSVWKNWRKVLPYFILSSFWVLFYLRLFVARATLFGGQQSIDPTLYNPFLQVPIAITSYLQLLFWPDGLTIYHSEMIFSQAEYILRVFILIGFLGFIIYSFKRNRFLFFWLSFFIITLLPTINPFVHAWVVAERYVYLGTLGVFASLAWVFEKLFESHRTKTIAVTGITIVVIALSIRTITRNADWSSEDTLWPATARTSPSSAQNHNNLGDYYGRHGDLVNSVAEFKRAIELRPNYADAYHNLGNAYRDMGKLNEAIVQYQKALSINPKLWQSYQNIAAIYYSQNKYSKALEYLKIGLEANPQNINLLAAQGVVYAKAGDKQKAQEVFLKILTIDPNNQFAKQALLQLQNNTLQ